MGEVQKRFSDTNGPYLGDVLNATSDETGPKKARKASKKARKASKKARRARGRPTDPLHDSMVPDRLDPATRAKYLSICRKYGLTPATKWADVLRLVERTRNQNTRRSDIIALRTLLGNDDAMRIPKSMRRIYPMPDPAWVREQAAGPYEGYILAMAWAGLRIGEAVAMRPQDICTNGTQYWIDVASSRQNLGGRYKEPKSGSGTVFIPEWLFDALQGFDHPEILPNSLYKWMKRRGLQPHGLRHFYCTTLVRSVSNVEMARRQMRHSNLQTTLGIYFEVEAQDEIGSIAGMTDPGTSTSNDGSS